MNYGDSIVGAARLVWRHPHLWMLGIIMALFGGGGGRGSFNFPTPADNRTGRITLPEPFQRLLEGDPGAFVGAFIAIIAVVIVLALIWFVAGIILRPVARGGLACSVDRLESGDPSSFGTAWRGGWRRKGSLIGISLLLEFLPALILVVVIILLVVLIAVPIIAAGGNLDEGARAGAAIAGIGAAVVAICCLVIVALIVGAILGVLTQLSSIASALEGLGARSAVSRAWRLMRDRTGPIVLVWLISGAISLVIEVIVMLPLSFLVFGIGFGLMTGNAPAVLWALAGFAFVIAIVLALLINGALQAYGTALWTLTFRSLTRPSRIEGIS